KEAGAHLGYGKYADAITKNPSGSYSVDDPTARAAIMKLRDDPEAASSMAAVLTQSNSFKLTGKIGRRPTDAELYMAHFMGAGGTGDRQRRLSLELPGSAQRDAGCGNVADCLGGIRADLPLAVPGRRTHAADLAGGAGIVGQ